MMHLGLLQLALLLVKLLVKAVGQAAGQAAGQLATCNWKVEAKTNQSREEQALALEQWLGTAWSS